MLFVDIEHDIIDGNIGNTAIGSISGECPIVGYLQTSPGADHSATVELTIHTGQVQGIVMTFNIYPANSYPIVLPVFGTVNSLSYSTVVSGSNGHYSLQIGQ